MSQKNTKDAGPHESVIAGKTVSEWNKNWEPLPEAFKNVQSNLRHVIGLVRICLEGDTKYILRATEVPGGIAKGLKRVSGRPQTGNRGYGAQMILANINDVQVDILRVNEGPNPVQITKDLKIAMVKFHDPEWNRAHQKWMTAIKESTAQISVSYMIS